MTKKEFLARCANAYDVGLCTPERLNLLSRWLDAVMRFEGGQLSTFIDFLNDERKRNNLPAGNVSGAIGNLAGDTDGYALIKLAAILSHPCQTCATDKNAWWTRSGFCTHVARSYKTIKPISRKKIKAR